MKKVLIYDTTLRDGTQAADITFSVQDKLRITRKLDELGVHYVEGGWPGSNPRDIKYFQQVRDLELVNTRVSAFGSTHRKGVTPAKDEQVKDLVKAKTSVVTIVGKSWDMQVREVLKASRSQNLSMIRNTVDYLKQRGLEVLFDAEHFFDGYKNNSDYALEVAVIAAEAGADGVCLCDTNGGSMPDELGRIVALMVETLDVPVSIHTHNDCEMAVANSVIAVLNGASMVQGTINGIGERAGNANLCSIIPNLSLKLGIPTIHKSKLKKLREVSHFVYEQALVAPPRHQPYVGQAAFAHKGGQHSNAVLKNPTTYEHVSPESVGNRRRFLVSDLSGTSTVANKAQEYGIELDRANPLTRKILDDIKKLEEQGFQFEGAEASFELLMKKTMGGRRKYFTFKGFRVIDEKRPEDQVPMSEATVMVEVGNTTAHTAAVGVGPVNALDNALRKALLRFFPSLGDVRLMDYKVRVLPAGLATASQVRVLIESTDGKDRWGTVGVSDNIIEASWQALIDSIDYKLYKDEKKRRTKTRGKR